MKKAFTSVLGMLLSAAAIAQEVNVGHISDSLAAEGIRMYRSEMASWYGTDIFLARSQDKSRVGAYFSYAVGDSARCIFYSKGDTPVVLGEITLDSTYNTHAARVDLNERGFTEQEQELYLLRTEAQKAIKGDTLFKHYTHTSLNLIPLISGGQKKVYVLTGPSDTGIVIFGNDYLLTFDENNQVTEKKALHRNIIIIHFPVNPDTVNPVNKTMHTHLPETGEFITATDICTLLLYEKFAHWHQHYVLGPNYMSIWDCDKDILVIISNKVYDKIMKDQERRHPKSTQ